MCRRKLPLPPKLKSCSAVYFDLKTEEGILIIALNLIALHC